MRPAFQTTIGVMVLLLSACEMKVKQAKTPPAPLPTVARSEPPPAPVPAEPLSIPQTQVRLPEPQPIDPESVVTPSIPAEPSPARSKKRRAAPQAATAAPAKPEPVETAAEAPPTEAPPRRMEPVLPEGQRLQRIQDITAHLKEVEQTLARVATQSPSESQKRTVDQIRNFVTQAYAARDEGDIQKASGLADRALLLVQDLARGR